VTQDQIIQTLHKVVAENQNFTTWTVSTPHLVGLVNHAIAEEREACAKEADKRLHDYTMLTSNPPQSGAAWSIASAIRARGQA